MHLLKTHEYVPNLSAIKRDKVYRRGLNYKWLGGNLYKKPSSGKLLLVPSPPKRMLLIETLHNRYGHFC